MTLVLLLSLLTSPGLSDTGVVDYRVWLEEEVPYIISRSEIKEFKKLQNDSQRAAFVERFWKKRDADPSTEANPFREVHYRRLEFANKHFPDGGPGWRTDRGRIYIIHGEPDQRLVFPSEELRRKKELGRVKQEERADPAYHDITISVPEAELWSYRNRPDSRYLTGNIDILFMRVSRADAMQLLTLGNPAERTLDRNQFYSSGLYRGSGRLGQAFQIVYAGTPRFNSNLDFYRMLEESPNSLEPTEIAQTTAELLRSPGDLLEAELARRSRVKTEVASSVFFDTIPASLTHWFLRGDSYTYTPLAIHVPGAALAATEGLAILIEARRGGELVAEVVDELKLREKARPFLEHEGLTYQTRLATLPGPHQIDAYLLDRENGRYTHLTRTLEVPDLARQQFFLSQPILCKSTRSLSGSADEGAFSSLTDHLMLSDANPLKVDDFLLVPNSDGRFRRKDTLTAFFEVYEPALKDGLPDLELQIQLLKDGRPYSSGDARLLDYLTRDRQTKVSYAVSLGLSNLPRGNYRLRLEVLDRLSGEIAQQSGDFRVY